MAAQIIGAFDPEVSKRIAVYKQKLSDEVLRKVGTVREEGWENGFDA
jgi:phosphoribosylcarboxyaminoimidazole (NCAIR) mutase